MTELPAHVETQARPSGVDLAGRLESLIWFKEHKLLFIGYWDTLVNDSYLEWFRFGQVVTFNVDAGLFV